MADAARTEDATESEGGQRAAEKAKAQSGKDAKRFGFTGPDRAMEANANEGALIGTAAPTPVVSANKIFTDDDAAAARVRLMAKLGGSIPNSEDFSTAQTELVAFNPLPNPRYQPLSRMEHRELLGDRLQDLIDQCQDPSASVRQLSQDLEELDLLQVLPLQYQSLRVVPCSSVSPVLLEERALPPEQALEQWARLLKTQPRPTPGRPSSRRTPAARPSARCCR